MDTNTESMDEYLLVTDIDELEEGNEYYFSFYNSNYYSNGLYKVDMIFISFWGRKVAYIINDEIEFNLYLDIKSNSKYLFTTDMYKCKINIYKLTTTDYVLK